MPNTNPAPITPLKPKLRETSRVWRKLLYSKIENIFLYDNLPEEIPKRLFNLMLFRTGKTVFYKIGEKYTVQPFSYNDILNWYYVPLKGRVVNPYLPAGHQNWEFNIEDECIIYNSSPDIQNFRQFSMTADLIFKTANQLAENDISYYCIQRNSRLIALFTAQTDLHKREMDKIIEKMYEGETDITMTEDIISHVQANPLSQNSTRNSITELIEFQQYILANFYHSFGINSNYNLKREQLNSDEINVNQEVLRLNIEDMLKCREDGVEKINKKFGLNITVRLNEKLYATLLQQANLFQSGTIDTETGLQETQYVDTDNVSQNDPKRTDIIKLFMNSMFGKPKSESEEDENAQKESKSGTNSGNSGSGNSNYGNIGKSRSDSDPDSDTGSSTKASDRSVDEDNNDRNRSNVEQKDDNKGSPDVQSDPDRGQSTEERSSSGNKNEPDSGDTKFSDMGTDSASGPSEAESDNDTDSDTDVNSSPITININVSNADTISVDNADTIDMDEVESKSSQNDTKDSEENEK